MSSVEKTVSALIETQLPEFVRSGSSKFQRFLELYYTWLENNGSFQGVGNTTYQFGNTVFHIQNIDKYRDIDETLDPFIRLFKQELLPYFPENTSLDLVKILKGAREFYVKKGSEESVKWLFRVLFDEDVQIYYPKRQILIASDGKWKLPQAFQLTLTGQNLSINPNLLEKHKGIGSISTATCIIESANKTIDSVFGNEILEIYVSNVSKEFENGENLEIEYTDEFGIERSFSEKIIGAISGIRIDSNIKTDPQQRRRGLTYNVGDPVVVFGGLDSTPLANDAVAVVGNVTVGSIEGLNILFPGYGYRTYWNTESIVYRSETDDPNANQSTDIRAVAANYSVNSNSQFNFSEYISVDMMPINYLEGVALSATEYSIFTQNNRNIVINVTETNSTLKYNNFEDVYANGASYETANFRGKILTSNSSVGFGAGGVACTATIILFAVSNTVPLNTTGFLVNRPLIGANTLKQFTVNSITNSQLPANIDSQIQQTQNYQLIQTGGVSLFNIINGGYGFRTAPTVDVSSYFDTYESENYDYAQQRALWTSTRQPMGAFGYIAHVYVDNPGIGYANGDSIVVSDRGYGFTGYVNVNSAGAIMTTTITNRGEGYYGPKTARVVSATGTGGAVSAYGFGEGLRTVTVTGAIGRISDVRMKSRGFDYISAPLVSFKVVDIVIDPILENETLTEGERVYQGASLVNPIFTGIVKEYNRTTNVLRLFNYSGASFGNFNASIPFTSEGGVSFTVNLTARVPAPTEYPIATRANGLPNPWFYGNGRARGIAEFYNGLIKYPGFFINTDGFLSADKKTQDGKTYHNYSYVIESEKSLVEYRASLRDIVHPAGMSMQARTTSQSSIVNTPQANTVIYLNAQNPASSLINVQNSYTTRVNGVSTEFNTANVGDLLIITDTTNPLRSQVKTIKTIESATTLNVDSNFIYVGQGRLTLTNGSSQYRITGNSNNIFEFLQIGDQVLYNIAVANVFSAQTGTVAVTSGSALVTGTGSAFNTQLAANDIIRINNQVKKVVNIASATILNVNSAFTATNTGIQIQKLATIIRANVTGVIADYINTDASAIANANNLVYKVNPDYKSVNYDYEIITVTE
jgi:hypothetical protein